MKLYLTPGSCSTGIHILLEELELVFEAHLVNLLAGTQNTPEYLAMNPKATIPTLVRNDGTALTEFQAIAYWLARSYPKAKLLPGDPDGDARVIELMDYVIGTLHGQGFTRIFTTDRFTPNEADFETVKAQGLDIVKRGFAVVNDGLSVASRVCHGRFHHCRHRFVLCRVLGRQIRYFAAGQLLKPLSFDVKTSGGKASLDGRRLSFGLTEFNSLGM
jgi:glutathione S-transferase